MPDSPAQGLPSTGQGRSHGFHVSVKPFHGVDAADAQCGLHGSLQTLYEGTESRLLPGLVQQVPHGQVGVPQAVAGSGDDGISRVNVRHDRCVGKPFRLRRLVRRGENGHLPEPVPDRFRCQDQRHVDHRSVFWEASGQFTEVVAVGEHVSEADKRLA